MLDALIGMISPSELEVVKTATRLRFAEQGKYKASEALILYEQGVLSFDSVTELVRKVTGVNVETPRVEYIHKAILEHFNGVECVPYLYDNVTEVIYVGVLPEDLNIKIKPYKNKEIVKVPVPMHWYVKNYTQVYTKPKFILELPAKDIFNFIVNEAISLGAADITLSSRATKAKVYYNVRKKRVDSKRSIAKDEVDQISNYVANIAGSTIAVNYRHPIYFSVELGPHNRGRCVIVKTYHGLSLSIRVLPNELFETTLEDLNLKENVIEFIRGIFNSSEKGLRLMVGPTFSGKNTTIASALRELLGDETLKGVSVEQPVELLMDFLEQIDAESEQDYAEGISSLLRQSPDVIYVTEITDYTAKSIMNVSNTGKYVVSSVHSNTLSDVVSRLQDLTGYSTDRVIQNLHSMVYQELVRDDEKDVIYPINRCIHFDNKLKSVLYGKDLGTIIQILQKEEDGWLTD